MQNLSSGPYGKSGRYARDAVVPEFFVSLSYKKENLLLTAGVDVLTIKPRTQSEKDGEVYKVKESLTTPSVMVAGSYSRNLLRLAAKVVYGKNLSYLTMNGGYGVHDIDPLTGAYTYTPYANLTSWFNVTYGKKWQGGLFLGHSKNLGTTQSLVAVDKTYGQGLNIDNLLYAAGQFSFNIPDFTVGLEYGANTAYYGTQSLRNGRVLNPCAVTNHRILLLVIYYF